MICEEYRNLCDNCDIKLKEIIAFKKILKINEKNWKIIINEL